MFERAESLRRCAGSERPSQRKGARGQRPGGVGVGGCRGCLGWRVGRTDWLSILEVLSPSTLRDRSRSWDLILDDGEAQKGALN